MDGTAHRANGRVSRLPMPSVARQRFEAALDALVEEIREDNHILAAILCGSLSHDEVWDKSDIGLVLVCVAVRRGLLAHPFNGVVGGRRRLGSRHPRRDGCPQRPTARPRTCRSAHARARR